MTCKPGFIWCLSAGDCVPEDNGCKGGREWWEDEEDSDDEAEDEDDFGGKEIRCGQGTIFCASVQVFHLTY